MFGGFGMYRRETFFGIIFNVRLYFNNDSSTVSSYTGQETKPFRLFQKQTLKFYYKVPVEILEDGGELVEWARKAVATRQRLPARRWTEQIKFQIALHDYRLLLDLLVNFPARVAG